MAESAAFQWPLVTVVTPSYNQGRFIATTIESVLSQDYPNLEYIVMDGGSTDETAEVCARYAGRLTFISERDRGQSHAINKGFAMARGEIVAWLNSDDIFLPGAILRAVDELLAFPEAGAVYGEGYRIDVDGNVIARFDVTQEFNLWKLVHLSDYILQQTVFFRRSVFDEIGFLDESLHYGMDWEILMRIGKHRPLRYIPYDMGSIREHDAAKTSVGGMRRVRELLAIMRRHGGERWPPGLIVYGMPPLQQIVAERIERHVPFRRVRRRLIWATVWITNKLLRRTIERAQGWYPDSWAGRRARVMLPPAAGRYVIMSVELPAWAPFAEQAIDVYADGVAVAHERFAAGSYELLVRLGPAYERKHVSLTIDAARTFVPLKHGFSNDRRHLAFILRAVEFSDAAR